MRALSISRIAVGILECNIRSNSWILTLYLNIIFPQKRQNNFTALFGFLRATVIDVRNSKNKFKKLQLPSLENDFILIKCENVASERNNT